VRVIRQAKEELSEAPWGTWAERWDCHGRLLSEAASIRCARARRNDDQWCEKAWVRAERHLTNRWANSERIRERAGSIPK